MKGSSKRLQARLDRIRERAEKKLLVGKFTRLSIVLRPGGPGYETNSDDWEDEDDHQPKGEVIDGVLTITLPIIHGCAPIPEPPPDELSPTVSVEDPTPQEAPSEAEVPEYVEYDLDPALPAVLDEPEENQTTSPDTLSEPDDHSDGRYGDQQRYADPDEEHPPELPLSVTRHGDFGWE